MKKELIEFFRKLVEAPSPSGFEQPAQRVFKEFVQPYCDELITDKHGNVIASKHGKGKVRIMLAGHADEVGMIVKHIDDDGFIYFNAIGGIDLNILPAKRVDIHHGKKICRGVIGSKAIHLMDRDKSKQALKEEDLWIDIGAKNREDAEKMVSIGDVITYSHGLEFLANQNIVSKALDNKIGVFVVGAVLQQLANDSLDAGIFGVSSVQEEIGLRGARTSAYKINPDIGIAIDVIPSTDYPTTNKKRSGDIKLGKGAVLCMGPNINNQVFKLMKETADSTSVQYQINAIARATGTDANAMQITREGVATGLISIPNRYTHAPSEIVSLDDTMQAVKMVTEFCRKITDNTNLIPE